MLYDPHVEPIREFRGEWRFLSNFYRASVTYEGDGFTTVEHAFQAAKSNSRAVRLRIAEALTPGDAKRMGRRVDIRPDWESVKLGIMEMLLRQKFEIWNFGGGLVRSYPRQLIEGNTWGDRFWGECSGVGENHLGKILMEIRLSLL